MSAAGAPRLDHYCWAGGREAMLRFGPDGGPTIVMALPLLEEANRTRALGVQLLHLLAARGIAGALPDLPGTGESEGRTEAMRLPDLRAAFTAAVSRIGAPIRAAAIRSGALLIPCLAEDGDVHSARGRAWHLSPQTGSELLREWTRLRAAGDGQTIGGNRLSPALWDDLAGAVPPPSRVVRLAGDPRPADRVIDAAPPWRRAEPDRDDALAAALADDIAAWVTRCAG